MAPKTDLILQNLFIHFGMDFSGGCTKAPSAAVWAKHTWIYTHIYVYIYIYIYICFNHTKNGLKMERCNFSERNREYLFYKDLSSWIGPNSEIL